MRPSRKSRSGWMLKLYRIHDRSGSFTWTIRVNKLNGYMTAAFFPVFTKRIMLGKSCPRTFPEIAIIYLESLISR